MRTAVAVVVAFVVSVLGLARAGAEPGFRRVPLDARGKASPLTLRALTYQGSTNGVLAVEVHNPGKRAARFSAEGLYFIPGGDPDEAPQRLGAVGPMRMASGEGKAVDLGSLEVAPGATVRLELDVFCIDSHRPSPSPENTFTVARTRMPKTLSATIESRGKRAADDVGGYRAAPAKAAVQSEVWRARDAKWIKLDGEGAQEQVTARPRPERHLEQTHELRIRRPMPQGRK
jgi:hypothetical protein